MEYRIKVIDYQQKVRLILVSTEYIVDDIRKENIKYDKLIDSEYKSLGKNFYRNYAKHVICSLFYADCDKGCA
jgi:hypothetical protein